MTRPMLAVLDGTTRIVLYRHYHGSFGVWRDLAGDSEYIGECLKSARELDRLAQEVGGWDVAQVKADAEACRKRLRLVPSEVQS